jgi:hypothetical protein
VEPWIPVSQQGWEAVAEVLAARPVAWEEEWAIADLRWYVHVEARRLVRLGRELTANALRDGIPGRPTLTGRWHWTDYRVRMLLRTEVLWWDTARWGPNSPAPIQRSSSAPPADLQSGNGGTPANDATSPVVAAPSSGDGVETAHARGVVPSPSPSPSPVEQESAGALALPLGPVVQRTERRPPKPKAAGSTPAGATRKPPKTPRDGIDKAWAEQVFNRWKAAYPGSYAWDYFAEKTFAVRIAGAVGVELNQPFPVGALERIETAFRKFLDEVKAGRAFPPQPTLRAFVHDLPARFQAGPRNRGAFVDPLEGR